jgi:DNA-binding NarL/FixJ family response regulator
VLLAHGDKLVRARWHGLLDLDSDIGVAGEAATGREAVVMGVRLPGLGGVEATRQIFVHPELSTVEVLLLSEDERDEDLLAALRAGANGFLTMETDPADLLRAVRVVTRRGTYLSPSVTRRLIDKFVRRSAQQRSTAERFERLTVREREVVALVALGLSNREIAERLVVTPATAKTHVSRSMIKLHVRDRAKLIALAYETGFAQDRGSPFVEDGPQVRQRSGLGD